MTKSSKTAAKANSKKQKPAAGRKGAEAAPEPQRAAAPKLGSDQFKCPAEADVVSLVRRLKSASKVAQEKAGEMGEMIAKACETKHFDRKALSIVRGLESMSDNKLQVTLPHLLMYIDALGLSQRASNQGQLIADAPTTGGADMDDDEDDDANAGTSSQPKLQVVPKDEDERVATH